MESGTKKRSPATMQQTNSTKSGTQMVIRRTTVIVKWHSIEKHNNNIVKMRSPIVICWRRSTTGIFFVLTKAAPNPIKCDYQQQRVLFLLRHKLDKIKIKCNEFVLAASRCVWDDEFNKMVLYWDLINYHNVEIQDRWVTSGKNKFGQLFSGFKPNNIDGLGVLNWIKRQAVPQGKKVTSYPWYTVVERPEKAEIHHTRITCNSNVLDYFGDVMTHIVSMETIKLHWNLLLVKIIKNVMTFAMEAEIAVLYINAQFVMIF